MYNTHFGFREKPFKLVPDPDYLYLSKNHEIALAHLTYAVSQGDGFVVITGEVGTGKTTLCRIFLDRLDENIESAYIFNPKLESKELLSSICSEFGIQTQQENIKHLLDKLNQYLIAKNQVGQKVILLIDEAQNLSVENLEMVRMLSNLETSHSKLLQIVLVGQPELGDKLESHELRQLAQRISLSAHLMPLNLSETAGYIQHRLTIAAQRPLNIFTRGACLKIFRFSRGIPRLINIACDRALLTAFSLNRPKVTTSIAKSAVAEVTSRGRQPVRSRFKFPALILSAAAIAMLAAAFFLYPQRIWFVRPEPPTAGPAAQPNPAAAAADQTAGAARPEPQPPAAAVSEDRFTIRPAAAPVTAAPQAFPAGPAVGDVGPLIQTLGHGPSRLQAIAGILACWGQPPPIGAQLPEDMADAGYFEIAARQYGLRMYTLQANWRLVKQLNLPAILSLRKASSGETVYLALVRWQDAQIQVKGPNEHEVITTTLEGLLAHLNGPIYVYWKNVLGADGLIGTGSTSGQVIALKQLLRRTGYNAIDSQPLFDGQTRQAVIDFQIRSGIEPDGLVGPLTKMLLIQASGIIDGPLLDRIERKGTS